MHSMDVYEVSLELEPRRGSEQFGTCEGLFVVVYVTAPSLRAALDGADIWANASKYTVLDVDYCLRVNLDRYEPHTPDYPSAEAIRSCLDSGDVITGVFHSYDSRAES